MQIYKNFDVRVLQLLKKGGIAVIPTDTIYGIVGSALNKEVVERIYHLRKRNKKKPMIVLLGSIRDVQMFGIRIDSRIKEIVKKFWPGKVSIIFPISDKRFAIRTHHLHRGTGEIAFRVPDYIALRKLLKQTGPLVAPSANIEGEPPSATTAEAQRYFGERIDAYIDRGKLASKSSTLIAVTDGKVVVLREGAVKISSRLFAK